MIIQHFKEFLTVRKDTAGVCKIFNVGSTPRGVEVSVSRFFLSVYVQHFLFLTVYKNITGVYKVVGGGSAPIGGGGGSKCKV